MSLLYTNFPIYIGAANGTVIDTSEDYLPTTQASVKYNTTANPKRSLGSAVATGDQFKFGQPMQANISLTSFIYGADSEISEGTAYGFTEGGNQDKFFPIQVGGNVFHSCYVQNYSINVLPYQPVAVSANFVSLNPPTGSGIASTSQSTYESDTAQMGSDFIVYGHTCAVNNMTDVVGSVQSQISYEKSFGRTPVYTLGSINATSMLLDSVTAQMSITSTGIGNLIDFSGNQTANDVTVELKNILGSTHESLNQFKITAGARVMAQDYSMGGGDTLVGSVTLKEVSV